MHTFKDTKELSAHIYLDYMGHETTRDDLIEEIRDDWVVVMFYVGGGFVPLSVAVGTTCTSWRNPDISSPASAMHEYFMNHRPDELDDDGRLPEELYYQVVPRSVVDLETEQSVSVDAKRF